MYKKLVPLASLLFILVLPSWGQTLTPQQQREDFELMADSIRAYQITLPEYGNEEEFEATYRRLLEELDEPRSVTTFFGYLLALMATTGESHNRVGFPHDPGFKDYFDSKSTTTPFSVKIFQGQLHVQYDYSGTGMIPQGAKLLTINGWDCKEVMQQLMQYGVADGEIMPYRERLIETYWNLWFPWFFEGAEEYTLTFLHPESNQEGQATVAALTYRQMGENIRETGQGEVRQRFSKKDVYDLQIEDEYAVLTLKTFNSVAFKKAGLNRSNFYTPLFLKLIASGVSHLIVDVRSNQGGPYNLASDWMPYVVDSAYAGEVFRRRVALDGEVQEWKVPEPNGKQFEGEIYVLTDSFTASGGSNMAKYLKEFVGATVIGTETGSRYQGYASGYAQVFRLPHSGYQVEIYKDWTQFPHSKKQTTQNRGLIPDYEVAPSLEDWLAGADPAMAKALELIREE